MPELSEVSDQAARMGYGLQSRIATDRVRDILSVPMRFGVLWILCNTGDRVQRRWLAHRFGDGAPRAPARESESLDRFCREELSSLLGEQPHQFLFPVATGDPTPPLIKLLGRVGLYRPSPIMNSLHHQYGSWWAVRAVVALSKNFEPRGGGELGVDPCIGCGAPCVDACPTAAVTTAGWHWEACVAERRQYESPCGEACPARVQCPIGQSFRYTEPVMRYHYSASLETLRNATK